MLNNRVIIRPGLLPWEVRDAILRHAANRVGGTRSGPSRHRKDAANRSLRLADATLRLGQRSFALDPRILSEFVLRKLAAARAHGSAGPGSRAHYSGDGRSRPVQSSDQTPFPEGLGDPRRRDPGCPDPRRLGHLGLSDPSASPHRIPRAERRNGPQVQSFRLPSQVHERREFRRGFFYKTS